ncbi:hypothetical protein LTR37_021055 [Vermiconidia calcicola]|uniref:Uncharacterized protein n=1 Tax=Vermiconidia calcicola TaxID=1690605 RepID=A0ACC3M9Q7_9PEZI|nr:hypothetical protein LTR37_021055 [Vermiconidia calcicola]
METIPIDPRGDVCFVLDADDEEKVGFVVSSKVLTLASDVFSAMLSPRFREGDALMLSNSPTPLEISLFDDSPTGMRVLLNVPHHRPTPKRLIFQELIAVATLVDKYNCRHIFQAISTAWIAPLIRGLGLHEELPDFLGITIAFENEDMFAAVFLGLALTTGTKLNTATAVERIEGRALADLVSDEICRKLYTLRGSTSWKI